MPGISASFMTSRVNTEPPGHIRPRHELIEQNRDHTRRISSLLPRPLPDKRQHEFVRCFERSDDNRILAVAMVVAGTLRNPGRLGNRFNSGARKSFYPGTYMHQGVYKADRITDDCQMSELSTHEPQGSRNWTQKIRRFRIRAVRVPMDKPHRTASGAVTESPLVLTDVFLDDGAAGHSIIFTYTAAALTRGSSETHRGTHSESERFN